MKQYDTSHSAALSALSLSPEETALLERDMEDILAFLSVLSATDPAAEAVPQSPTYDTLCRADIPQSFSARDALLQGAQELTEGYIALPRVMEE